jgi:hypothetical protein
MFMDVNCSKSKLVEVLKGQSFKKWNALEDLALKEPEDSFYY